MTTERARRLRQCTILMVDDEEANLDLLDGLLEQEGYERRLRTNDARTVLTMVETHAPDLVLLDLHMPHRHGLDVLTDLRARTAEGDFRPVLVLTADTTWEARERALQRGAHDFVTKPFEAAEVLLRVERLLETRLLHAEERTARARAERATEERERLLAVVAHDLRNPLAVVAMYAETMQLRLGDRAGGGEAAALLEESCETILRNTVGMQRLVEDLLDASALQDGAFRVHRIVQPLGEPFDGAARTLGPLAEARGVTFTIVSEAGAADENGALDRPRVEQLLSNLGGNAIRFTPTGGRVEVRYAVIDDRLVVSVSDEGPGIAPEDADHLFTAFWRGAHANGRGGAGLGLWIAKGIVDAHGGTLAVESTPGRGATFRFTLPLHTAPSETAAP